MAFTRPAFPHSLRTTWANLPSATTASPGTLALVSDLGITGTSLVSNGTYWRVEEASDVVLVTTAANGTLSGLDQVIRTATLPAGLLRAGRYFCVKAIFSRAGSTDAATTCTVRLGTAGTTADHVLMTSALLTETNQTLTLKQDFVLTSATQAKEFGTMPGVPSTVEYPALHTIPNVDTQILKLSAGMHMAGTTDLGTVQGLVLTLFP